MSKKLFDYVIGNPPYNADFSNYGDNDTYATPVYNLFLDEAYKVGDKVEMIHPARFLFNAGSTPKAWNEKMLNDEHLKILKFEQDSSKVFTSTDIKGGLAISYHDETKLFGAIHVFTAFRELNDILQKVEPMIKESLSSYITGRGVYKLSDLALKEHPEIIDRQSKGHKKDIGSGAFSVLKNIVFFESEPIDEKTVKVLGLVKGKRVYQYGIQKYIVGPDSFFAYKVIIPQSNGSGEFGEILSNPIVEMPNIGATETFLSIGCFSNKEEADACLKYIKTKFARAMLGILKATQACTKDRWKYVPLQNFKSDSDIDWSKSISEIDQQLYKIYGLNEAEINFIETHVKEMV